MGHRRFRSGDTAGKSRRKGGIRGRVGHSLFLKLLLVLAAAAVLANLAVGAFFRMAFSGQSHGAAKRNLEHYAELLAREIGAPPDTALARRLAREYSLQIRYEGPGGAWSTEPGLEAPAGRGAGGKDGTRALGWKRGRFYVRTESQGASWLFAADFHSDERAHWPMVAGALALVSGILAAAYLAIRRILAPIRDLSHAVERLGTGDLGVRVPDRRRRDELGELARAFNAMSARLGGMIRSREQLLLDVSHELRSPLTRIKVALEMAPEGVAKESIRDDLGEMDAMIGEIMEAARLDSAAGRLNPEPVDLAELAGDAARAHEGGRPGVTVRRSGDGGRGAEAFRVRADRERIRKVLSNVLDNAVKYSREGSGPVEMELEAGDAEVRIRVRDSGIGIPAEEIPRLFEPFYRVDRSRSRETGGYGLGLSLCKRIMEAHGGRVTIESRVGKGTTVELLLPRS